MAWNKGFNKNKQASGGGGGDYTSSDLNVNNDARTINFKRGDTAKIDMNALTPEVRDAINNGGEFVKIYSSHTTLDEGIGHTINSLGYTRHTNYEGLLYFKNGGGTYASYMMNYYGGKWGSTQTQTYIRDQYEYEKFILIYNPETGNADNPDYWLIPKKYIDSGQMWQDNERREYNVRDAEDFLTYSHALEEVEHDDTLTGDGTPDNPLSVAGGGGGAVSSVNGQTGDVVVDGTNIKTSPQGSTLNQVFEEMNEDINQIEELVFDKANKIPTEDKEYYPWASLAKGTQVSGAVLSIDFRYGGDPQTNADSPLQNFALFNPQTIWDTHPDCQFIILIHFTAEFDGDVFGEGKNIQPATPADTMNDLGVYILWIDRDNKFHRLHTFYDGGGGEIQRPQIYTLPILDMTYSEGSLADCTSTLFNSVSTMIELKGIPFDLIDTVVSRVAQHDVDFCYAIKQGNVSNYRPFLLYAGDELKYENEFSVEKPVYLYSVDRDFHFKFKPDGAIDAVFDDEVIGTLSQPGKIWTAIGVSCFDFTGIVGDESDVEQVFRRWQDAPVLVLNGEAKIATTTEALTAISDAQNRDRKSVQIKDVTRYNSYKEFIPNNTKEVWRINNPAYVDLPDSGAGCLWLETWLTDNEHPAHVAACVSGIYVSFNLNQWTLIANAGGGTVTSDGYTIEGDGTETNKLRVKAKSIGFEQIIDNSIGTAQLDGNVNGSLNKANKAVTAIYGVYKTNPKTQYPKDGDGVVVIPEPKRGQSFSNRNYSEFVSSTDTLRKIHIPYSNDYLPECAYMLDFAHEDDDPEARQILIRMSGNRAAFNLVIMDNISGDILYEALNVSVNAFDFHYADEHFGAMMGTTPGSKAIGLTSVWHMESEAGDNAVKFTFDRDSVPGVIFPETLDTFFKGFETKEEDDQHIETSISFRDGWDNFGDTQLYNHMIELTVSTIDNNFGGDWQVTQALSSPQPGQNLDTWIWRVSVWGSPNGASGIEYRGNGRLLLQAEQQIPFQSKGESDFVTKRDIAELFNADGTLKDASSIKAILNL